MYQNAGTSRFGLILIGKNSNSLLDKIFGDDGWTKTQRNALLAHEIGHSIIAIPIILIEVIGIYFILSNAFISVLSFFALPTIIYAFLTIISWTDELIADMFAGPGILSNRKILETESYLGSTGYNSHPPNALRYLTGIVAWPGIFILLLIALYKMIISLK